MRNAYDAMHIEAAEPQNKLRVLQDSGDARPSRQACVQLSVLGPCLANRGPKTMESAKVIRYQDGFSNALSIFDNLACISVTVG